MNTTGIHHSKALPRLHIKVTNYTPKLLSYGCSYDRTKDSSKEGMALRPEELETIGIALRELGMSYDETVKLMSEVTIDSKSL